MSEKVIALSTGAVPPPSVEELGLVHGSCVISRSILGDTAASVRNKYVGGELKTYTRLLDEATRIAVKRMSDQAVEKGADGIYAIQFMAPQVAAGAAEVVATGTAYRQL